MDFLSEAKKWAEQQGLKAALLDVGTRIRSGSTGFVGDYIGNFDPSSEQQTTSSLVVAEPFAVRLEPFFENRNNNRTATNNRNPAGGGNQYSADQQIRTTVSLNVTAAAAVEGGSDPSASSSLQPPAGDLRSGTTHMTSSSLVAAPPSSTSAPTPARHNLRPEHTVVEGNNGSATPSPSINTSSNMKGGPHQYHHDYHHQPSASSTARRNSFSAYTSPSFVIANVAKMTPGGLGNNPMYQEHLAGIASASKARGTVGVPSSSSSSSSHFFTSLSPSSSSPSVPVTMPVPHLGNHAEIVGDEGLGISASPSHRLVHELEARISVLAHELTEAKHRAVTAETRCTSLEAALQRYAAQGASLESQIEHLSQAMREEIANMSTEAEQSNTRATDLEAQLLQAQRALSESIKESASRMDAIRTQAETALKLEMAETSAARDMITTLNEELEEIKARVEKGETRVVEAEEDASISRREAEAARQMAVTAEAHLAAAHVELDRLRVELADLTTKQATSAFSLAASSSSSSSSLVLVSSPNKTASENNNDIRKNNLDNSFLQIPPPPPPPVYLLTSDTISDQQMHHNEKDQLRQSKEASSLSSSTSPLLSNTTSETQTQEWIPMRGVVFRVHGDDAPTMLPLPLPQDAVTVEINDTNSSVIVTDNDIQRICPANVVIGPTTRNNTSSSSHGSIAELARTLVDGRSGVVFVCGAPSLGDVPLHEAVNSAAEALFTKLTKVALAESGSHINDGADSPSSQYKQPIIRRSVRISILEVGGKLGEEEASSPSFFHSSDDIFATELVRDILDAQPKRNRNISANAQQAFDESTAGDIDAPIIPMSPVAVLRKHSNRRNTNPSFVNTPSSRLEEADIYGDSGITGLAANDEEKNYWTEQRQMDTVTSSGSREPASSRAMGVEVDSPLGVEVLLEMGLLQRAAIRAQHTPPGAATLEAASLVGRSHLIVTIAVTTLVDVSPQEYSSSASASTITDGAGQQHFTSSFTSRLHLVAVACPAQIGIAAQQRAFGVTDNVDNGERGRVGTTALLSNDVLRIASIESQRATHTLQSLTNVLTNLAHMNTNQMTTTSKNDTTIRTNSDMLASRVALISAIKGCALTAAIADALDPSCGYLVFVDIPYLLSYPLDADSLSFLMAGSEMHDILSSTTSSTPPKLASSINRAGHANGARGDLMRNKKEEKEENVDEYSALGSSAIHISVAEEFNKAALNHTYTTTASTTSSHYGSRAVREEGEKGNGLVITSRGGSGGGGHTLDLDASFTNNSSLYHANQKTQLQVYTASSSASHHPAVASKSTPVISKAIVSKEDGRTPRISSSSTTRTGGGDSLKTSSSSSLFAAVASPLTVSTTTALASISRSRSQRGRSNSITTEGTQSTISSSRRRSRTPVVVADTSSNQRGTTGGRWSRRSSVASSSGGRDRGGEGGGGGSAKGNESGYITVEEHLQRASARLGRTSTNSASNKEKNGKRLTPSSSFATASRVARYLPNNNIADSSSNRSSNSSSNSNSSSHTNQNNPMLPTTATESYDVMMADLDAAIAAEVQEVQRLEIAHATSVIRNESSSGFEPSVPSITYARNNSDNNNNNNNYSHKNTDPHATTNHLVVDDKPIQKVPSPPTTTHREEPISPVPAMRQLLALATRLAPLLHRIEFASEPDIAGGAGGSVGTKMFLLRSSAFDLLRAAMTAAEDDKQRQQQHAYGEEGNGIDATQFATVLSRWLPGLTRYQSEQIVSSMGLAGAVDGGIDGMDFVAALEALAKGEGYSE